MIRRAALLGIPLLAGARALGLAVLAEHDRLSGRYDSASRRAEAGLAAAQLVPAPDPLLVIRLLNCSGMICKARGEYARGMRAYRQALRLARGRFGAQHGVMATLLHNLGGMEHARGRYRRAEVLARRGLAIRERLVGAEHPDAARDAAALAGILDGLGRHADAEMLHRRALGIFEGRRDRREIAAVLANLAACLHLQGRREEAKPIAIRALELQVKALGAAHSECVPTCENLAVIRAS